MLKKEIENSYIIVQNQQEYELLNEKLKELGFEDSSIHKDFFKMYAFAGWDVYNKTCIIYKNSFQWINHTGGHTKEIKYLDIIFKEESLENNLLSLLQDPKTCIYLGNKESRDKMNELCKLFELKWRTKERFDQISINDVNKSWNHKFFVPNYEALGSVLCATNPSGCNETIMFSQLLKTLGYDDTN